MAILVRGSKEKPPWLDETRDYCRRAGISVVGWGPNMLTVEAKSPSRATEIANQLGQLGFKVVKDEDDEYAGLLSLSQNPEAVQAATHQRTAAFDISRRRWPEQVEPLIWLVCSSLLIPRVATSSSKYPAWFSYSLGLICLVAFFWDGARIWGWRLELVTEGLRIRRYFRWTMIPWEHIQGVESISAGRSQEALVLKLASRKSEGLGKFDVVYSRNTRDRLRQELAQRTSA
ncbi:MAG TPA: hypothetical protein VE077_05575 [Candidatus Methylomirabilis sp.]|nr:hypothetical protein [Candidatus Methylomirabilis sp.]